VSVVGADLSENRMFGRLKNNLLLAIAVVRCSAVLAASFDCAKPGLTLSSSRRSDRHHSLQINR
jgi:hypothetical protein